MGIEEVKRIKEFFTQLELHPTYLEHTAVITSEDAANQRGFMLKQGIKALLFTDDKNNWVIVNVPADKKVNTKKVATKLEWPKNKIRMATIQEVLQKTGCEIGAVPPFGHKENLPILTDKKIYDNIENAFNIGLRTQSVKILTKEIKIVFEKINSIEGEFTD